MSYIRTAKRENPFVQLDKNFIGYGELSLKATGLLTYILSKPDGWQIRMKDIQKRFTDGESSVRSGIKELRDKLYINRFRERNDDGTFGDYVYEVYERPEYNPIFSNDVKMEIPKRENHKQGDEPKRENPEQDNPEQDNPEQENHVHSNNDFNNNDFSNNKSNSNNHLSGKTGLSKAKEKLLLEYIESKAIDDDLLDKLIDRLKLHKFGAISYIDKVYNSILDESNNSSVDLDRKVMERMEKEQSAPEEQIDSDDLARLQNRIKAFLKTE